MTRLFPTLRPPHLLVIVALGLGLLPQPGAAYTAVHDPSAILHRPAELERDVRFWIQIYSEVDTGSGLIHDTRNLGVVYETIHLPERASNRSRERQIERVKKHYRTILLRLARGDHSSLTLEQTRVLNLWPAGTSTRTFRAAASQLRFQLGQADKFKAGVIRSGRWKAYIENVFREHGLPVELTALPHVESSFTPHAYSRVGAAGLWQFTRSTGRRFMRVDHVIDERLDAYRATQAAARLLKQNREVTGAWPLAITAYNHGASGMRRAARKLGTHDIATIARQYKSRTFGFASRNFYVEFLAALEVSRNYRTYFGELILDKPIDYEVFELPFYTTIPALSRALGVDRSTLEEFNPALRPSVRGGEKRIPRRFALRVPRSHLDIPVASAIERIPQAKRYASQTRDRSYRVRRGDTLSGIAKRFHISVSQLVAANGLRSRHRIHVGQVLRLPDDGSGRHVASRPPATLARQEMPADGRYTVRRGDSLHKIATRFGTSEKEILAANNLRNKNRIYPGQKLWLKRPESAPAAEPKVEVATAKEPASEPERVTETVVTAAAATAPAQSVQQTAAAVETNDATPAAVPMETIAEPDPHPETAVALSAPPDRLEDESAPSQGSPILAVAVAEPENQEGRVANLLADPSEYGVGSDDTIEVQGAETLGHYAEWLGVRTSRLRSINRMPYGKAIGIGQRMKLDLSRVDAETFELRRRRYHQELQEEFFARFEIEGTSTHVTRRGDSVWVLAERKYRVPVWLLRQYNPDVDFAALQRGTQLTVPRIKERDSWESEASQAG